MSEFQKNDEIFEFEEKIKKKYSNITKLLFLIGIILIVWFLIVFSGVFFLDYDYNWAVISFENWVLIISAILVIFILFEILFYFRFSNLEKQIKKKSQPKPEFIDGKHIHVFTYPKGVEGGIFSKTYVEIDSQNVLRLRTLIIPPNELWSKNEPKEEEILKDKATAKFEVYKDKAGEYRFRLKAPNGEIIAVSEGYKTKKSCMNGIESVKKNVLTPKIIEK